MKTIVTLLVVCAIGVFFQSTTSVAQQQPARPSTTATARPTTTGTIRSSTEGTIRRSTENTVRPSTSGTLRPSTEGTIRRSTENTIRPSTSGTLRPSTEGTIRPSTTGTVRPDTTRPQPRDTVPPVVSTLVVRTFPNPASVRLTVRYGNVPAAVERVTVKVLTLMGEEVATQTVAATENEVIFDVSGWREGQYGIVVIAGRAVGRAMVIVRH